MFRQLIRDPDFPSRAEFAEAALQKLSENKRVVNLRHSDPVGSYLDFEYAGKDYSAILQDAYAEYRLSARSDEERDTFVKNWAADLTGGLNSRTVVGGRRTAPQPEKDMPDDSPALTIHDLLPSVTNIDYLNNHREVVSKCFSSGESLPPDYDGPIVRPLFEDLVMMLCTDHKRLLQGEIEPLGITEDEAWAAAFENINSNRFSIVSGAWREGPLVSLELDEEVWLTTTLIMDEDLFQGIMEADDIDSVLIALPRKFRIVYVDETRPDVLGVIREQLAIDPSKQRKPGSQCIFRMKRGVPGIEVVETVALLPRGTG
jgi:hypothetical protein